MSILYFRLNYNFYEKIILKGVKINMYHRIRDMREDRDLNQTQVAKFLGMSQTGYSKYETGENDIPTQVLIKLAQLYNVSVDYILGLSSSRQRLK